MIIALLLIFLLIVNVQVVIMIFSIMEGVATFFFLSLVNARLKVHHCNKFQI